jgi:tight adherence protein C
MTGGYIGYILAAAAFLLPLAWLAGCAAAGRRARSEYGALLAENRFSKFIAFPAYILKHVGYEGLISYDKKIKVHIIEYYGKADSELRFLLHQATKAGCVFMALEFCLLISLRTTPDTGFLLVCALSLGSAFLLPDSRLSSGIKKRKLEIMLDFPDFLVKLTLLINAGMNVAKAWEKTSEGMDRKRALGRELAMSLSEIRSGKSESKAYEDFAKRCRIQEVTRVVSVLLQNIKKGNAELVSILRIHANECWEMRKNAAKKLGEEASSKMLLPMAIMLLSILLIVTTPAILALQGLA